MSVTPDEPLDLDDPDADAFLEGIQGDILRSHGRNVSRHMLPRMTGEPAAARRRIADVATRQVTGLDSEVIS